MADHDQPTYPPVGQLLRDWRAARRMSQLDLAMECGMSARHLGFVELGKAEPSRDTIGRFADALDLSLRERNALLLAAGYAPNYDDAELSAPGLDRMRQAIDLILQHQNPYPAFVLNRHFDVLNANESAGRVGALIAGGQPPKHSNLLHQIFDPGDLRPIIANWSEVAGWFLRRLQDELAAAPGNPVMTRLLDEVLAYPDVPAEWRRRPVGSDVKPVLTIDFISPSGTLSFFETITTFAAPLSVTLDELRIDCTFPADDHTASVCRKLATGELP
ncbi:MAG: helix-turn-helix transcriptional regulator [Asticcacaulis sp.]|nr:helix-turn-helix transcriptional regulator [Asticcacaulis sp.]